MFYITISNGLLTKEHRDRMGSAVWEFMWCIDKVTMVLKDGTGIVLGGKPINLSDLSEQFGVSDMTISRNLNKLQEEEYITLKHTPYGIIVHVKKVKKRFNKNVKPRNENVEPPNENVEPNKTVSIDITDDTSVPIGNAKEIGDLIKSFELINPACKKFYGNTTQRAACQNLIDTYGFERVKAVIEKTLPKTNNIPYFPTITTPVHLRDKWASLEAQIMKSKSKQVENKTKVAFI